MLLSFCEKILHFRRNGHIIVKPYYNPSMAVSLPLIRFFSGDGDDTHSFTISYLINSCGLAPKSALSASKSVNLKSSKKPNLVLSCLEKLGFSQSHISEMVRKFPPILNCKPEKTICPKVEFFRSKGASTPELVEIFTINPKILKGSIENHLGRTFNMLAELFGSECKALEIIKRNPWVLYFSPEAGLVPNINTSKENGVPLSKIMLLSHKFRLSLLMNPVKFRKILEEVEGIGFNRLTSSFVVAIGILTSLTKPKRDRRVEVYKSWGWSDEDFAKAFRKHPTCMAFSDEKIMAAMDFYVNQLGLDSSVVAKYPVLLGFSLKKRLILRGAVIQALSTKGMVKMDSSIVPMFVCTDECFIAKYVKDPHLEKLYRSKFGFLWIKIRDELKMH